MTSATFNPTFINQLSKLMLQFWLEGELAKWESVGLGWAFLRTLPEHSPKRTESGQIQAAQIPEGQSNQSLVPGNPGAFTEVRSVPLMGK